LFLDEKENRKTTQDGVFHPGMKKNYSWMGHPIPDNIIYIPGWDISNREKIVPFMMGSHPEQYYFHSKP
jgi:hypothetical protein